MGIIFELVARLVLFILSLWWLWLPVILVPFGTMMFVFVRQRSFEKKQMDSFMWEMRIPREVARSPKAMEQVLQMVATNRNAPGNKREFFLDGELTLWHSLEMVYHGGQIHFYVRAPKSRKNVFMSAFSSYYPDVELVPVEDYVHKLPDAATVLYGKEYDVWGTELNLRKDPAIPIRTYANFETLDETAQIDPLGNLIELMTRLDPAEFLGIQILLAPADPKKWTKSGQEMVKELKKSKSSFDPVSMKMGMEMRTPGETDKLKAIETNIGKPAFDTLIRVMYLAPKKLFNKNAVADKNLLAALNQYTSNDYNMFWSNSGAKTKIDKWQRPFVFPKRRLFHRKARLMHNYEHRHMPEHHLVGQIFTSTLYYWNNKSYTIPLNVEAVATIFHPPTSSVLTGPHIDRMESRHVGAPAGLAIYGDDESIAKFL